MRLTALSVLVSLVLAVSALTAETAPFVNVAFEYGFGAQEYVDIGKADKRPARLNHDSRAKNLESFVITYQARRAFGDLAYRAGFFYSLNPLVLESANRVTVHMSRISKYPDLVKRFNAVRPLSVEATVSVVAECEGPVLRTLFFKINTLDLVYGASRDGKDRSMPVVPLHLRDRISLAYAAPTRFSAEDKTTDEELRKILNSVRRIHDRTSTENNGVNVDLNVTWPDQEIEQIARDYERYEKEGKKAEKDYAFLKDAPKEKPYAGNDELALPIDASPKSGEAFEVPSTKNSKWRAGIRVKDKVVFESEDIWRKPEPLDEKKTMFLVQMRDEVGARLINTKGKWIQYEGYSRFILHEKRLVGVPDHPVAVYTSQKEYQSKWYPPVTEAEFQAFKGRDQKRPAPRDDRHQDPNVLEISFASYTIEFFRGEFLTLDENNKKVVAREPAYFAR